MRPVIVPMFGVIVFMTVAVVVIVSVVGGQGRVMRFVRTGGTVVMVAMGAMPMTMIMVLIM